MTRSLMTRMTEATALTRAGKLTEATALLQQMLGKAAAPAVDPDVIEGSFRRVDPAAAATAPRPAKVRPRSGLGDTFRRIAAGGMAGKAPLSQAPVDVPHGARFLSLTHVSGEGRRDYRLYIPAKAATAPMPLIVMLHGCTQTPEDFAIGTGMNALAEEFGLIVAYPAQPTGANAQKCWNWFRPEDQGRGQGEPALIAGLTQDILRDHPVDPGRVYVAGLSAGGAAAAIVASAYPEVFSAVGVHSGLPIGGARDIPSAFQAMRMGSTGSAGGARVPTIVFHGTADSTVHPDNGTAVLDQSLQGKPSLRRSVRPGQVANGHRYRQTRHAGDDGPAQAELWEIEGAGHAWSGGKVGGSYVDPNGPDASREMVRFFLEHRKR